MVTTFLHNCSHCGTPAEFPVSFQGKQVRCPHCGETMSIAKSGQQLRSPGQQISNDGTPPIPGFLQDQQVIGPAAGHGHSVSVEVPEPGSTTGRGRRKPSRGVSNGHVLGLVGGLALATILIVVLVLVLAQPDSDENESDPADNLRIVDANPDGAGSNAQAPSRSPTPPERPNDGGPPPRDPPVAAEPDDVAPDAISLADLKSDLELQADAALALARTAALISIRESSEFMQNQQTTTPFTGIDDGVARVFIIWPAFGSFIVIQALATQTPAGAEEVNFVDFISSEKLVDAAMESLQNRRAEDYYGRAALQYAFWKVASRPSPQHDAEIAASNLQPAQKRTVLSEFNILRQQVANNCKSNYEELMRRGAKAGLQVP